MHSHIAGVEIVETTIGEVLILVVMEDALALRKLVKCYLAMRLNPCCNGRCTRTYIRLALTLDKPISLNPCCNGRCTRTLMELKDFITATVKS